MRLAGTRVGMQSSLVWLVLWAVLQLVRALSKAIGRSDAVALALSGTVPQFLLLSFGFAGLMIFGMAQHFVPLFAGRDVYSPRLVTVQVLVANAAVAAILAGALAGVAEVVQIGFALWALAAALFVASIVLTLRLPVTLRRPSEGQPGFRAVDRRAIPMTAASAAYLLGSAFAFLLTSLPQTNHSFGPGLFFPSALHLYTLGFVTLMIFGVGLHLFPRFLGVPASSASATIILALGVPMPLGVALFMNLPGPAFPIAAALEALAALVFVAAVVWTFLRSAKRRPAFRFVLASLGFLATGVALGAGFGIVPASRAFVPVHGWINLAGFVGLMIFGVLQEVVSPYAFKGYAAAVRAGTIHAAVIVPALIVYLIGEAMAIAGMAVGDAVAALGLLSLTPALASYAWGTIVTMRHVVRSAESLDPLSMAR